MGYKVGIDKKQLSLFPASLDEYVPENHICRLIYAFTEQLDMTALGYKYAECKDSGCRPYDPRMMLNLYIYGYTHRVRSSRRLRDETIRNVEVMWLMEGLRPDDKTICNFRKDNSKALRQTFRAFSLVCRELGLYGREVVATDSVKVRANNCRDNHYNETRVTNALSRIEKKISEYLNALEQEDRKETPEQPSADEIKVALERLKARKEKYEELSSRIEKEGEVSTVDSDARMMRSGGDGRELDVCYSVHTVVDSKHHLIVDFEVSNCSSDAGYLKTMTDKAKEILEVETLTNLADAGYYSSKDLVACEQGGDICLVAKPPVGGPKKAKGFTHQDFIYDRQRDVYICPCKEELTFKSTRKHISGREYRVYSSPPACRRCEKKTCCTSTRYREVSRLSCQDILDGVDARTRKHKALYKKRKEIVEHCFGTVKAVWGYRQFLCRGKGKVGAEMSLAYIAYNMRRVFNIFTENEGRLAMGLG